MPAPAEDGTSGDYPPFTREYAASIIERMRKIALNQGPGYSWRVITQDEKGDLSNYQKGLLRLWLRTSVKDFYYYGHGSPLDFSIGDYTIMRQSVPPSMVARQRNITLYVPALMNDRSESFPFDSITLNMCNSYVNDDWRLAFEITDATTQTYVGYDGISGTLSGKNLFNQWSRTSFFTLDTKYWQELANGYEIGRAWTRAQSATNGSGDYWPPARRIYGGYNTIP